MTNLNRVLRSGTFLSTTFLLLALGPVFAQAPDQHDEHRMQHQGQRSEQRPDGRPPNAAVEAPHARQQQRDEATGQDNRRRPEANPSMRAEPRPRDEGREGAQMRKGMTPSAQEQNRRPSGAAPTAIQNQDRRPEDRRNLGRDDRVPSGGLQRPPRLEGDAGQRLPRENADRSPGTLVAPTAARRLDDVRRDRREVREGNQTVIREPGRTIVQQGGHDFIVHDETDRFRALGFNVRRERRGNQFVDTIDRPGGEEILTFTDESGRLLRRVRRTRDGREFVLIDNGLGSPRYDDDIVVLPPPAWRIPRDRYIVDYRRADADLLYDTLIAPPLVAPARRYTLDQIRYSPDIRGYLRAVEINTINFDSGSWDVPASATGQLEMLATAIKRAIDRNPNSIFLVEGYTDATGDPEDNLSLSDRRAQAVAEVLTKGFDVPPENLTTQGYGEQNLKEATPGPSAANRRVVVQNVTQMLVGQAER